MTDDEKKRAIFKGRLILIALPILWVLAIVQSLRHWWQS